MNPTFQGEVQFRRWSDSSTQGVQVTFALPDSDALDPLKGMEGKRFMAVLVQIGDDEQPVQAPRKDTRGPLCKEACDYVESADFKKWVESCGGEFGPLTFILRTCDIESRKELDENPIKGTAFKQLIRIPFFVWQRDQRE